MSTNLEISLELRNICCQLICKQQFTVCLPPVWMSFQMLKSLKKRGCLYCIVWKKRIFAPAYNKHTWASLLRPAPFESPRMGT